MPPTYVLAKDHLQRAATMLRGSDSRTRQLRYIIERTIVLMDEVEEQPKSSSDNVLDLSSFRSERAGME